MMKFNINGFLKFFILCLVMTLGFFVLYGLILGVPTSSGATVLLMLLAGASVFGYFWMCVERKSEDDGT